MASVKTFDKTNLKTIRTDVDKALAAVCKKHGITLNLGNIRFDNTSFSAKLTAEVKTPGAKVDPAFEGVKPAWVKSFKTSAFMFGLDAKELGKSVKMSNGKLGTIVGLRPRANAPVVVRLSTGGFLAVSVASTKAGLRLAA